MYENVGESVLRLGCVYLRQDVFHRIKYDKARRFGINQSCILIVKEMIKTILRKLFCDILKNVCITICAQIIVGILPLYAASGQKN